MRNSLLDQPTCWGEQAMPIALPRTGEIYGLLAHILDETTPQDWRRVRTSLVVDREGVHRCHLAATCGSPTPADQACLEAVHEALLELGTRCVAPACTRWIGLFVQHDFETGTMRVDAAHGGRDWSPSGLLPILK